jgi:hypothetical protein
MRESRLRFATLAWLRFAAAADGNSQMGNTLMEEAEAKPQL